MTKTLVPTVKEIHLKAPRVKELPNQLPQFMASSSPYVEGATTSIRKKTDFWIANYHAKPQRNLFKF